jgi:transcriptional regulator with XRE-family HTH domain
MLHEKLINERKTKRITQEQMAKLIAMEQTTYSRKERGKSPILDEEWERFAKALNVNVEDIKGEANPVTMKNENWSLNDNSIGIQYVNIPQNAYEVIMKYNKILEDENERLKEQLKKV